MSAKSTSGSTAITRTKSRRAVRRIAGTTDPALRLFAAMNEAGRRQRCRAYGLRLLGPAHRGIEIVQPPVMNAVDQPVDGKRLAAPPRLLDDRGIAHIVDLLDDVELAQHVGMRRFVGFRRDHGLVLLAQRADAVEPIVDKAELVAVERRLDAAAAVVPADDDAGGAEHVDGALHPRQAGEADAHDRVGEVAVDENLAGK